MAADTADKLHARNNTRKSSAILGREFSITVYRQGGADRKHFAGQHADMTGETHMQVPQSLFLHPVPHHNRFGKIQHPPQAACPESDPESAEIRARPREQSRGMRL